MGIFHAKLQVLFIWGSHILYGFYDFYCFKHLKTIEKERNLAFWSKDRSITFFLQLQPDELVDIPFIKL